MDLDAEPPACFPGEGCEDAGPCPGGVCPEGYLQEIQVDCLYGCGEDLEDSSGPLTLCLALSGAAQPLVSALREAGEGYALETPLPLEGARAAVLSILAEGADCAPVEPDAPCEVGCLLRVEAPLTEGEALAFDAAACEAARWGDEEAESTCEAARATCASDSDTAQIGAPCAEGVGACEATGALRCVWGVLGCDAAPLEPRVEVIGDGIDNDCDGSTDEADAVDERCEEGDERPCGVDEGLCQTGTQACVSREVEGEEAWVYGDCLTPDGVAVVGPAPELCDGEDNDCDGEIDEGITLEGGEALGEGCLAGLGACQVMGTVVCGGNGAPRCDGEPTPPSLELAGDGIDNDCDGETDEGVSPEDCLAGQSEACGLGVGACVSGFRFCEPFEADPRFGRFGPCLDGLGGAPVPERGDLEEVCDGVDNDCDGETDEALGGGPCEVGLGACLRDGIYVCRGAEGIQCSVEPALPSPEICDEIDNDCDGVVDNGFDLNNDLAHCGGCNLSCARPNAVMVCAAARCIFEACAPGFTNDNDDVSDGCECDSQAEDIPDPDFIDANCDGIDGRALMGDGGRTVFVSPTGAPDAAGTMEAPVDSLPAAAALLEGVEGLRAIYLDVGVYTLSEPFTVPSGVSIHGGYEAVNGWTTRSNRWALETKSVITGVPTPLIYTDTTPAYLDQVEVVASDASTRGGNSTAVWVRGGAGLTLRRVRLESGIGGEGAAAQSGGAPPGEALDGETPTCSGCGGDAGENLACPEANGERGGEGGPHLGAGETPAGPRGGEGGLPGEAGQDGLGGAIGALGDPGPVTAASGRISNRAWAPLTSSGGGPGGPGQGGGGGGGGGGAAAEPPEIGGGGAGGGAGGCGAPASTGAGGGGGSFALVLVNTEVKLLEVLLNASVGGRGGPGLDSVRGGVGGRGALGQSGGTASGRGGAGGRGGRGGCAGAIPGGPGGPSFGILRVEATAQFIGADEAPLADQAAALAAATPNPFWGGNAGDSGAGDADDGCVDAEPGQMGLSGPMACCPAEAACPPDMACGG